MNKKYIESSLLQTKEAIAEHILKQRIEQAKRYGMTLEEFMQAVVEGKTIVAQSSPQSGSL
jgi:DNA-binding transcriptional regulator YhcF (GntR family)